MPARPPIASPAPAFELPIHGHNESWSLADHTGPTATRPIVLIFHRHIH